MNVKLNILTSRFDFGSARTGRIRDNTSCLLEPAYARPSLEKTNKQTKVTRLFFPSVTQTKMNLISPNRSQTCDLLVTRADALLLNCKGLVGAKTIQLISLQINLKKSVFYFFRIRLGFATPSPIIRSGTLESKVNVEVLIQVVAGNQ